MSDGHTSKLPAEALYRSADLSSLSFETTADLEPVDGFAGQQRAVNAVHFGSRIEKSGFNLFAIGSVGSRMRDTVTAMLKSKAADLPMPSDWVYVNNFTESHKPVAIELPTGQGPRFRKAMRELIDDLNAALPMAFESEDYQTRRAAIEEAFQKNQADAFSALRSKAGEKDIVVLRTPMGFALAPTQDGQVVPPEEFSKWPEDKQKETQKTIRTLEKDLEQIVRQIPGWDKKRREELRALNSETAGHAVGQQIDEAKSEFDDIEPVNAHLEAMRTDLVDNVAALVMKPDGDHAPAVETGPMGPFERYDVNLLVTQEGRTDGVPVVEELHPTLGNLTGRIEYLSQQGVLVTNFRHIMAGALQRANGGYLLLDIRALLTEPYSWTALKRVLQRGDIRIEDIDRVLGLTNTVKLEPDPIPLNLKIVLFGDRMLYYMLAAIDPQLGEHFKVLADFEDDIDRSSETEAIHARLIAAMVRDDGLRPIEREGVGLLIEHAARLADDAGKLTLIIDRLRDVMVEADFLSTQEGRDTVSRDDIQRALDERTRRASRLRERSQEQILRNIALIDTEGARTGQINGLSVLELGGFRFGRPTRITCRVRPGGGTVVDIEREAKLGGPIHSKGVLILAGYLAGRYAIDTPMSLHASLVFEQSYGGVEGDSASSVELYALLSALADIPLRQDIAVTGSVNQHGDIQAIGGVNEKIEGFFDICKARGLTGTQGVAIPQSNLRHLMLRRDVVEACKAGMFAVYPLSTVDEGIALLTGRHTGVRADDGTYPKDTINAAVEARLRQFAAIRQRFGASDAGRKKPEDEAS